MTNDRTIVLTRFIKAPPETVWRCWTDPTILPQWFGPEGYSCRTKQIDLRQGGLWQFDMIGPDGKVWPNRHQYTLFDAPHRIEFTMFDDADGTEHSWVVVTLVSEAGGTRLTQTMTMPTAAIRDQVVAFGAVELGQTTMAKLARFAEAL